MFYYLMFTVFKWISSLNWVWMLLFLAPSYLGWLFKLWLLWDLKRFISSETEMATPGKKYCVFSYISNENFRWVRTWIDKGTLTLLCTIDPCVGMVHWSKHTRIWATTPRGRSPLLATNFQPIGAWQDSGVASTYPALQDVVKAVTVLKRKWREETTR